MKIEYPPFTMANHFIFGLQAGAIKPTPVAVADRVRTCLLTGLLDVTDFTNCSVEFSDGSAVIYSEIFAVCTTTKQMEKHDGKVCGNQHPTRCSGRTMG